MQKVFRKISQHFGKIISPNKYFTSFCKGNFGKLIIRGNFGKYEKYFVKCREISLNKIAKFREISRHLIFKSSNFVFREIRKTHFVTTLVRIHSVMENMRRSVYGQKGSSDQARTYSGLDWTMDIYLQTLLPHQIGQFAVPVRDSNVYSFSASSWTIVMRTRGGEEAKNGKD